MHLILLCEDYGNHTKHVSMQFLEHKESRIVGGNFKGLSQGGCLRSTKRKQLDTKSAEKYILTLDGENSERVRVFGQFHTLKEYYPKELFKTIDWVPYEDTTMPVPVGYREYLELLYGDYMTPPPIDKRIPAHDVVFVDCNTPYIEYRGKKYLKG